MSGKGWIGVDFDGTLARYDGHFGSGDELGAPIPLMVGRVKAWLAKGIEVRIMTARVGCQENDDPHFAEHQREIIGDWCEEHVGQRLAVTNKKDFGMVELWDDRAVAVVPNTGIRIGSPDRERE